MTVSSQNIGFIEITNKGGYTAKFEITYSSAGNEITRHSPEFNLFQTQTLITPNGVNEIRLTVDYMVFLGIWKNLINIKLPSTSKCFDIYGTVFDPQWTTRAC